MEEQDLETLRERLKEMRLDGLSDDAPPRPVDKDLIRRYLRRDLSPERYHEVAGLIADYRSWHDAEREIFLSEPTLTTPDVTAETKEDDGNTLPRSAFVGRILVGTKRHWKSVAVLAACASIALGSFWLSRPSLRVPDGDYVVTLRFGNLKGLEDYPLYMQEAVQRMLATGFERSAVLEEISGVSTLRTLSSQDPSAILLSPVGVGVTSQQPTLRWRQFGGAVRYKVVLYSAELEPISSGTTEDIEGTEWTPPLPLERGRVYWWRVFGRTPDGKARVAPDDDARAAFKVLTETRVEDIHLAEGHSSHLVRLALYVDAGMLSAAEAELDALSDTDPRLARALRKSLKLLHPAATAG